MRGHDTSEELSPPAAQLVELAREELGEMSARRRAEGFLKLTARRSPGVRHRRLVLSFAAALAVVALVLVGHRWLGFGGAAALSYAVDGGRVDPTGAIEASGSAEPTLRFTDGTEVIFLAGARGRVRSVDEHGARIAVMGKVSVAVVPWRGSHWLFDAGPFLITVKGTAFTAEWRDAEERLEVVLKTGTVAVSGPLSDEAITLRAGQRLIISAREKEVVIRNIDSTTEASAAASAPARSPTGTKDDAASAQPEAPLSETPAHDSAPATATPAASVPGPAALNWTAELAAGRFATILQQAEQRGLDTTLAEVSSDDLAALADAARYSRRDAVARRALAAQRRRFPQSARANDAAFLLGRLEETAQNSELALTWYERCLTESPHGTYVSEALGRKMTVVQRLYGEARARPVAEEYLRRFGNGTYAAAARALTRAP
jgi:TolA-binding protein